MSKLPNFLKLTFETSNHAEIHFLDMKKKMVMMHFARIGNRPFTGHHGVKWEGQKGSNTAHLVRKDNC